MITGKPHEQYNSQPKARRTNPGSQVARATKFGTVVTNICDVHSMGVNFDVQKIETASRFVENVCALI
jgi:hypothetical protein